MSGERGARIKEEPIQGLSSGTCHRRPRGSFNDADSSLTERNTAQGTSSRLLYGRKRRRKEDDEE